MTKLNKEKKHLAETVNRSNEELMTQSDKFSHLNDVKAKLEQTRDQMEGALEKEKRSKGLVEKDRRRLEGELKMAQEGVNDLERSKRDMEQCIVRKENEVHQMMTQLDDEQSGMNRMQKAIKEQQARAVSYTHLTLPTTPYV